MIPLSLQTLADRSVETTGKPMIVFNLFNQSDDDRLFAGTFPSLKGDHAVMLAATAGQFVIECSDDEEAHGTFSTVCRDAATNHTAMIEGDILLIMRKEGRPTHQRRFDVLDSEYPEHHEGEWRTVPAPGRV